MVSQLLVSRVGRRSYSNHVDGLLLIPGEIPALDLSNELEELELDASHPSLGEPSSVEPAAALETPGSTFPEQSGDGASDVLEKDPDSPEDPWEAEEREEEEELTQEQLAHKKDFEKHRSDFYRIDRSILSAPVDDEEDEEDGEGNEAQTSREAEDQNMEEEEEQEEDQEGEDDEDGFSENKAAEDSDDDD